jgi:pyridoxamine 5'-phosphate oxidase
MMAGLPTQPECPEDWGPIRVVPTTVEFWEQAPDRMHDRLLYERDGDEWKWSRLAP